MYIDKVHKKACQLLINPLLFSLPHETGGLERMLTMPEIHYIKHLRENDDLSISEIARKLGKNWRTVKSMLMKKCILRILVQFVQNRNDV